MRESQKKQTEAFIPPHNLDAERAVLGAILIDNRALDRVAHLVRPEDFYHRENKILYKSFFELFQAKKPIDMLTLPDYLISQGQLDLAGGLSYLANLTGVVPSSHNIIYYADILKDLSIRRQAIQVGQKMQGQAHDQTVSTNELIENSQRAIFQIANDKATDTLNTASDLIDSTLQNILSRATLATDISGVATGFKRLDQMTLGFHPSELTIIGARPSIGKTAFVLNLISHAAFIKNEPVGFFSLEMSKSSIMERLLSHQARVELNRIRSGSLTLDDNAKLMVASERIRKSKLIVEDTPNIKIFDLRAQARRMKLLYGVKVIFVDYLGLISSDNLHQPKYDQVSDLSKSLKGLARELEIPIVVLSQLGRQAEGGRPTLADIRGSGSVEQDADVVMFLHRDRKKQIDQKETTKNSKAPLEVELLLAKQRNGAIGDIKMQLLAHYMLFQEQILSIN